MSELTQDKMPAQGFDVSVSVMSDSGPELAGEYEDAEFSIKESIVKYKTTNEDAPMLLPGELEITGKLKRGWLSVDIINRLYNQVKVGRGYKRTKPKTFSITFTLDSIYKGLSGKVRLNGVRFSDLGIKVKGGEAVVDKDLSFSAESIEQL